jgi:hypothetical protein
LALDAAYGSSDVIRLYRQALPDPEIHVGDSIMLIVESGWAMGQPTVVSFMRPDNSLYQVANSPFLNRGNLDLPTVKGTFEAGTYAIYVTDTSELNQPGTWSVVVHDGTRATAVQYFTVLP